VRAYRRRILRSAAAAARNRLRSVCSSRGSVVSTFRRSEDRYVLA
jgi:hypothetical protein